MRQHQYVSLLCQTYVFFFQAEDGIRDKLVTGVQTCALPISQRVWPIRCDSSPPFCSRPVETSMWLMSPHVPAPKMAVKSSPSFARVDRSEERRGGEEGRSRWSPYH